VIGVGLRGVRIAISIPGNNLDPEFVKLLKRFFDVG
jgi:hypothetical protein